MSSKESRVAKDTATETLGIKGYGETSQAKFGETITPEDLLFAVRREPVIHRIVFTVTHDIFDNWFQVEEVAEKHDPNFESPEGSIKP